MKDLRAKAERAKVIRHAVPGGGRRIQSLRAFRRAVLFWLFAWWVVGLLSLRLSVCSFDRGGFLRTFWEPVLGHLGLHGGRLGAILGSLGRSWDPSWGSGGSVGVNFGALGVLWRLWGSLGAPLAAQGAQSQIFQLFSLPFWAHFGSILEVKIDEKSDVIFH